MLGNNTLEILVIEDNPGDAGLFDTFFDQSRDRCRFHYVIDGEEALDFLHRRGKYAGATRPDLVVLDINIPRIDGKEVLREIKSTAGLKNIPVIVLTSSESESDIAQSYENGASCVLIKPSDVDAVIALFRSMETFWLGMVRYPQTGSRLDKLREWSNTTRA